MGSSDLIGVVLLTAVVLVFGLVTGRQLVRLRWELAARRDGVRTEGRVVGSRTVQGDSGFSTTYYRVRFTTAEGRTVEIEDELAGGAGGGGTVAVAYHPRRPEHAAVTGRSGIPSWVTRILVVVVLVPLTLGAAAALAALLGAFG